jgi:hypothetical protein
MCSKKTHVGVLVQASRYYVHDGQSRPTGDTDKVTNDDSRGGGGKVGYGTVPRGALTLAGKGHSQCPTVSGSRNGQQRPVCYLLTRSLPWTHGRSPVRHSPPNNVGARSPPTPSWSTRYISSLVTTHNPASFSLTRDDTSSRSKCPSRSVEPSRPARSAASPRLRPRPRQRGADATQMPRARGLSKKPRPGGGHATCQGARLPASFPGWLSFGRSSQSRETGRKKREREERESSGWLLFTRPARRARPRRPRRRNRLRAPHVPSG